MDNTIPIDWERLKKEQYKISILVNNPLPEHIGEGYESYKGYVQEYKNGFVLLHMPENKRLLAIMIKVDMILSLWVYR